MSRLASPGANMVDYCPAARAAGQALKGALNMTDELRYRVELDPISPRFDITSWDEVLDRVSDTLDVVNTETFPCDWSTGLMGNCFGPVEHAVVNLAHGDEYWACKRHHNLCIRKHHPQVAKR